MNNNVIDEDKDDDDYGSDYAYNSFSPGTPSTSDIIIIITTTTTTVNDSGGSDEL